MIGSDDGCEAKQRSPEELAALRVAADCIGSAIQSDRTQQAMLRAEQDRVAQLTAIDKELQQQDRILEVK